MVPVGTRDHEETAMPYDEPQPTQDEQRLQEVQTAHERLRGHVGEVRRLVEQGAPATSFTPYLDQIEADLNTARPEHVGWSRYQAPNQGVVTSPTGLSGVGAAPEYPGTQHTERDTELADAGIDGTPDTADEVDAQEHERRVAAGEEV
jgi:hypothetical protein